jgi:hypothetical protein
MKGHCRTAKNPDDPGGWLEAVIEQSTMEQMRDGCRFDA